MRKQFAYGFYYKILEKFLFLRKALSLITFYIASQKYEIVNNTSEMSKAWIKQRFFFLGCIFMNPSPKSLKLHFLKKSRASSAR